jgi:hypothetical protein
MVGISQDELRSLGDYATLWRWNLIFASLPAVGIPGVAASQPINLRCESVELPKKTNQKIEVPIRGHKIFQPGISDYSGAITVTLTETEDNLVSNLIQGWHQLVFATRSGESFSKADVEATILIQRLNAQNEAIYQYSVRGAWLEDYDLGTLDGNSSDIMRPSMTLSYDFFTEIPLSV